MPPSTPIMCHIDIVYIRTLLARMLARLLPSRASSCSKHIFNNRDAIFRLWSPRRPLRQKCSYAPSRRIQIAPCRQMILRSSPSLGILRIKFTAWRTLDTSVCSRQYAASVLCRIPSLILFVRLSLPLLSSMPVTSPEEARISLSSHSLLSAVISVSPTTLS